MLANVLKDLINLLCETVTQVRFSSKSSSLCYGYYLDVKKIMPVITSREPQSHFLIVDPKVAAIGNYTLVHSLKKEIFSPYITLFFYQSI